MKNDKQLNLLSRIGENNKALVLEALDEFPYNMYCLIHDELKSDKDIVFKIIQKNQLDFVLDQIPKEVFEDVDFAKKCIEVNPWLIKTIPGFNRIKEYALRAVSEVTIPTLYKSLSDELKLDRDVIITALKTDGRTLHYIPEALKSDKQVLVAAFKGREQQVGLIKDAPEWMKEKSQRFEELGCDIELFLQEAMPETTGRKIKI